PIWRVWADLREIGEGCGKHRIERIMRQNRIHAVRGYRSPKGKYGRPSLLAPNLVEQQFDVERPEQIWVTDITYVRTWQGWLYLAAVVDLYSRKVVGWSMKATLAKELALDALL